VSGVRLSELPGRGPLEPFGELAKIPWDDPAFSARMLREHLSQAHDRASRRAPLVDRHVAWIHERLLAGRAGRVLDLGCGPGLYLRRLARLGHRCTGIDFSPASVEHARAEAKREGLACEVRLADLRDGAYGSGFDLALLLSGELNAFRPEEAAAILTAAREALAPGGRLCLELHTFASVQRIGAAPPTWYAAPRGLFSDAPHVCLKESAWRAGARAAVERWLVVDAATAEVSVYGSTSRAYDDAEYAALLSDAGFADLERHPSLTGEAAAAGDDLFVLTAGRA
jgi:SAM-dependent methyltransferase